MAKYSLTVPYIDKEKMMFVLDKVRKRLDQYDDVLEFGRERMLPRPSIFCICHGTNCEIGIDYVPKKAFKLIAELIASES